MTMNGPVITPNNELDTLSDRKLLERVSHQIDHMDIQLHALMQLLDEHRPLLDRLSKFADPGKGMRGFLERKGKPHAG